ncbi:MAG: 1-deoxy-D-xylulose-5-phosphate reductoisomerase [Alphaproteobacteria bacterium]|nr:1-deoxy-D-xylulose-5-phosphate reductoisomerase [Alphaproteobacteria bacterium]
MHIIDQQDITAQSRKSITILGATGSIGDSTLDIIRCNPEQFEVVALTANGNVEKLIVLAKEFRPKAIALANENKLPQLKAAKLDCDIVSLNEAASMGADITVAAIVGAAGLPAVMESIKHGKTVALANKESLVCAGSLVLQACQKYDTKLLPIDSEHNAVFQVLATEHRAALEKVTLTASGGPFLNRPLDTFKDITPAEAVAHPKWSMGAKISVDSATMFNKGLELIEAHFLFGLPPEQLDVLIHPESIVHALVHYADGSVLAQLGMPDMRIPISYTLAWPNRIAIPTERLDLAKISTLNFRPMDDARFPALTLAKQAMVAGQWAMITLNAANEIAVAAFLEKRLSFEAITHIVERALADSTPQAMNALQDVIALDNEVRQRTSQYL